MKHSSSGVIFKKFKLSNKKNLRELLNNLSLEYAASSKEGITEGNVNYLLHLMNGSRLIKESREKDEHSHDLIHI